MLSRPGLDQATQRSPEEILPSICVIKPRTLVETQPSGGERAPRVRIPISPPASHCEPPVRLHARFRARISQVRARHELTQGVDRFGLVHEHPPANSSIEVVRFSGKRIEIALHEADVWIAGVRKFKPAAPKGGMNFLNAASRSGGIAMSFNPQSVQASASSTPEPPAPVTISTFSPLGVGRIGRQCAGVAGAQRFRRSVPPYRSLCRLGFDGVELPLRHPNQVDLPALKKASEATGLEIPSLSSGRVFAAHRLCFTQREAEIREAIQRRQYGMYEP
jgi:hypothetical protein